MRIPLLPLLLSAIIIGPFAAACRTDAPEPAQAANPQPKGVAPAFTLPAAAGGTISLADFRGHKPVLLYFSMGPG